MPKIKGRIQEPIVHTDIRDGKVMVRVDDARRSEFWMEVVVTESELEEWLATMRTATAAEKMAESILNSEWGKDPAALRAATESLARRAAGAPSGLPDFITPEDARSMLDDK